MRTLAAGSVARAETEVKRSRFLTVLAPVDTAERARHVIDQQKARYPDARHHCSAFVLAGEGGTPRTHFSDDGEPSGTAGRPMLQVLQGSDLVNVVAVVTRYFGGTLLGTGGLVRAYSGAVGEALREARVVSLETRHAFRLTVSPAVAGRVESEMRRRGWELGGQDWGRHVSFEFTVSQSQEDQVTRLLAEWLRSEPDLVRLPDRIVECR